MHGNNVGFSAPTSTYFSMYTAFDSSIFLLSRVCTPKRTIQVDMHLMIMTLFIATALIYFNERTYVQNPYMSTIKSFVNFPYMAYIPWQICDQTDHLMKTKLQLQ